MPGPEVPDTAQVTLTFDNGPDPAVTPQVLHELERRELTATFFPVGERVDAGGLDLVTRIVESGHRVGNHTYSHPRPLGALDAARSVAEIELAETALSGNTEPDRFFRPSAGGGTLGPGVLNSAVVDHLVGHGHTLVLWNVVCEDWIRPDDSWIDLALDRIARLDHALLVLHDIDSGAMDHLGVFLDRLLDTGARITDAFPEIETPIVRGRLRGSVDHLLPASVGSGRRPLDPQGATGPAERS